MEQMTDPAAEQSAATLVDDLRARGLLADAAWCRAMAEVPRHLFVPPAGRASPDSPIGESYPIDANTRPAQWWQAVYSDTAIVTQVDDGATDPAAEVGIPSSSISAPGMVAAFLELLDVRGHHRVLEIGTGTGYTAALLAHRLGADNITSIELDAGLAEQAAANLKGAGYAPRIVVGDGADGWPGGAPYDRVHVTCAVGEIPPTWITQTRPGGVIVLPWEPGPYGGYMVRLDVLGDGTATGRIAGTAGYMMMRAQRRNATWNAHHSDQATQTRTLLDPRAITSSGAAANLMNAALVPDLICRPIDHDDGEFELLLWDTGNTSWAEVDYTPGAESFDVYAYGPRRLWDECAAAYLRWLELGRPGIDRFGLTVTPEHERVWLDTPDQPLTPHTP